MTSDREHKYAGEYLTRQILEGREHDKRTQDPYFGCLVRHAPADILQQAPEYVPPARRSCIVRTSTLDPDFIAANPNIVNDSIRLIVDHDLHSISQNWTASETEAERRLVKVEFKRVSPTEYFAKCVKVSREDFETVSPIVSCIYWKENDTHIVTSVDVILILESFVRESFTIEEKNRIRRNLQSLKPYTISRANGAFKRFFNLLMSMENPRPRNIEQDLKVFKWDLLLQALSKVISKYSVLDCAPDTAAVAAQVSNIAVIPLRPAASAMNSLGRSLQASPPLMAALKRRTLPFCDTDNGDTGSGQANFQSLPATHFGWSTIAMFDTNSGGGGVARAIGGDYTKHIGPYQRESIADTYMPCERLRLLRPKMAGQLSRLVCNPNYNDANALFDHAGLGSRKVSSSSVSETHSMTSIPGLTGTQGLSVYTSESEGHPYWSNGENGANAESERLDISSTSRHGGAHRPGSYLYGVTQVSVAMNPSQTLAGEMTIAAFKVVSSTEGAKRMSSVISLVLDLGHSDGGEPPGMEVGHGGDSGGDESPTASKGHLEMRASGDSSLTKLPSIVENLNDPYLGPYESTTLPPLKSSNLPLRSQSVDSPKPREIGDFLRERQHSESSHSTYQEMK